MKHKQGLWKKLTLQVAAASGAAALLVPLALNGCGGGGSGGSSGGGGIGGALGTGLGIATGGRPSIGGGNASAVDVGIKGAGIAYNVATKLALTEDDERAMGQSVAVQGAKRWKIVRDDQLTRYVMMVAQALADTTPSGGRPVAFVLDSPTYVNAFSGPQGYVMITRALVARMDDESELAGVLAHEIGHVAEQHGIRSVKDGALRRGLIDAATITLNDNQLLDMSKDVAQQATESIYNQAQEHEADTDAVRLMAAAGYDPMGYVRILQKLQPDQKGGGNVFPTHPDMSSRITAITDQINKENLRGGQTNRDRFLAMTKGIRK